jgi:hypothetical protein
MDKLLLQLVSFLPFDSVQVEADHQKFSVKFACNFKTSLGHISVEELISLRYFNCPCLEEMDEPNTSSC